MKFFTTPNSKNIIATLRIVTIEKSELTFLLILYFHSFILGLLIFDILLKISLCLLKILIFVMTFLKISVYGLIFCWIGLNICHHQLQDVLINGVVVSIYTYVRRFDFFYKSSSAAGRTDPMVYIYTYIYIYIYMYIDERIKRILKYY